MTQNTGFRVCGLGVWGFRVWGLGVWGFRVWGLGVWGFRVWGQGSGFRVLHEWANGFSFWVQGFRRQKENKLTDAWSRTSLAIMRVPFFLLIGFRKGALQ